MAGELLISSELLQAEYVSAEDLLLSSVLLQVEISEGVAPEIQPLRYATFI